MTLRDKTGEAIRMVTVKGPYGPMEVQKAYDRWAKGRGFTWDDYMRYQNCWLTAQMVERRRVARAKS